MPKWIKRLGVGPADAAVAGGAAAAQLFGTYLASQRSTGVRSLDFIGAALLIAAAVPLVARRKHPVAVLALGVTCALVYDLLDYPGGFYTVPIAIGLYSMVAAGLRVQGIAAALSIAIGFVVVDVMFESGHVFGVNGALWFSAWLAVSVTLGEMTRSRRSYLAEVEQRAIEAERTREEEARRRAGEERLRIARELHDVLAHSISMINVRAGVASHLLDQKPQEARDALDAIKQTSKDALRELRSTLGVLRQVDDEAPRAPGPSLALLDELVSHASAVGLPVNVSIEGEPRALPIGVEQAAYRIVQESLTNVARHAVPATATVTITYGDDDVRVAVDDDGARVSVNGDRGHGITGMRERAIATGGELDAGPRSDGGWRVSARLPTEAAT
ncbi:MAG: sensor histidine kinase [Actinomycetota bacterium]